MMTDKFGEMGATGSVASLPHMGVGGHGQRCAHRQALSIFSRPAFVFFLSRFTFSFFALFIEHNIYGSFMSTRVFAAFNHWTLVHIGPE